MTIDWSDPAARDRLFECVGPNEYDRLHVRNGTQAGSHCQRPCDPQGAEPLRQTVSGRQDWHRIQRIRGGEEFRVQEEGSK